MEFPSVVTPSARVDPITLYHIKLPEALLKELTVENRDRVLIRFDADGMPTISINDKRYKFRADPSSNPSLLDAVCAHGVGRAEDLGPVTKKLLFVPGAVGPVAPATVTTPTAASAAPAAPMVGSSLTASESAPSAETGTSAPTGPPTEPASSSPVPHATTPVPVAIPTAVDSAEPDRPRRTGFMLLRPTVATGPPLGPSLAPPMPNVPVVQSRSDARYVLIHYLALHPKCSRVQLNRLAGHLALSEFMAVLSTVSNRLPPNLFVLKPECFAQLDVDEFPGYTEPEREAVRARMRDELSRLAVRGAAGESSKDEWMHRPCTVSDPLALQDVVKEEGPIYTVEQDQLYRRAYEVKQRYRQKLWALLQENAHAFRELKDRIESAKDETERRKFVEMARRKHETRIARVRLIREKYEQVTDEMLAIARVVHEFVRDYNGTELDDGSSDR